MEPQTICIYHGNCADGFGAAWVVREHFKHRQANDLIGEDIPVDFVPGIYQTPPPDVTDKDVIIVDFSYKRPVILEMLEKCRSLTIIDHHQSAILDLQSIVHPKFKSYFDLNHSGAVLTWLYFFGASYAYPLLLGHIEDRDLWKFKMEKTREIQAALFSYPYDFDVWDMLMNGDVADLATQGEAIERKHFKDIAELLKVSQRRAVIGDFDVPVANLPYTLSSDAGQAMNKDEPFAACWMETDKGFVFSLRSRFGDEGQPNAVDVSKIATAYGGGGHKQAAGFKVDRKTAEEFFTNPVITTDPYLQTK